MSIPGSFLTGIVNLKILSLHGIDSVGSAKRKCGLLGVPRFTFDSRSNLELEISMADAPI